MTRDSALARTIGRLIWVGVRGSEPGDPILEAELERCEAAHVGGIILFDVDVPERNRLRAQGRDEAEARRRAPRNILSPDQTRRLIAYLRQRLGPDLIVSIDQEGGAVSRLNPARGFHPTPSPRDYAALPDERRAAEAAALADTLASVGIDLNLAPCVDVAINPDAPGNAALGRSFGRDPERVAALAAEQIDAMHARNVACTLKHFPGHGSATGDTHFGLVDITDTFQEDVELHPYRVLLAPDTPCARPPEAVMISHLLHRAHDPDLPASLSHAVITGLLRERLGSSDILVLTDSLDMHAVADRFEPGEAALLAIEAGADVALEANNLSHVAPCPAPQIHAALLDAVRTGRIPIRRIEQSVARLDALLQRTRGATR